MNAPLSQLFLALQARVQATVAAIQTIDQDLGQLKPGIRPPVSWPCMLIDFEVFRFEDLSENVQTANGIVLLQLGFAPRSSSAAITPVNYVQMALDYYELEWDLHKVLQGWCPGDSFGSLDRISSETQKRNDSYRVREIRYSLSFDDYSARGGLQLVQAVPAINDTLLLPAG